MPGVSITFKPRKFDGNGSLTSRLYHVVVCLGIALKHKCTSGLPVSHRQVALAFPNGHDVLLRMAGCTRCSGELNRLCIPRFDSWRWFLRHQRGRPFLCICRVICSRQGQVSASSGPYPRPSAGTACGQPAVGSPLTLKGEET